MDWYIAPCVTTTRNPDDEFDTNINGIFPATNPGDGLVPILFPGTIVPVYDYANEECLVGMRENTFKPPKDWVSKTLEEAKSWFQTIKGRPAGDKEIF
jgi:hypothetical protein